MTALWIDDLRPPPDSVPSRYNPEETISHGWAWAKTSKAALDWIRYRATLSIRIDRISFDHDLGGEDTTRPVILWMCEYEVWPDEVYVHSANPPGALWIQQMTERYAPETTTVTRTTYTPPRKR